MLLALFLFKPFDNNMENYFDLTLWFTIFQKLWENILNHNNIKSLMFELHNKKYSLAVINKHAQQDMGEKKTT